MPSKYSNCEAFLDVQKFPKVPKDSHSNACKSEDTNIFGGNNTGKRKASKEKPFVPITRKWLASLLHKLDIAVNRGSNRDNQCCVQQDQSGFCNVGIVKKYEERRESTRWNRVTAFLHGVEYQRNCECSESSRQCPQWNIWDRIRDVAVSNIVKFELSIKSNKVPHKGNQ
ncbi:hypothetical protein OGATHE_002595 [Ogataea polymorpha]|uniref:Uncharacterized protein n=1 Tax=Ogataea polymorpha TaxID=460523 RepID=A0A9P8T815_9ASCO|nr:hypothetical protein OGATHE_002595 [Ogataea polymorpha]